MCNAAGASIGRGGSEGRRVKGFPTGWPWRMHSCSSGQLRGSVPCSGTKWRSHSGCSTNELHTNINRCNQRTACEPGLRCALVNGGFSLRDTTALHCFTRCSSTLQHQAKIMSSRLFCSLPAPWPEYVQEQQTRMQDGHAAGCATQVVWRDRPEISIGSEPPARSNATPGGTSAPHAPGASIRCCRLAAAGRPETPPPLWSAAGPPAPVAAAAAHPARALAAAAACATASAPRCRSR